MVSDLRPSSLWKMEAEKALYRRFFPNARISDSDLELLLNSLKTAYPHTNIQNVFIEMQQDNVFWNNFKSRYPHADIVKFQMVNTTSGGKIIRNVYYVDHWAWGDSKISHNFSSAESTFPNELSLSNVKYPIPGLQFSETANDIAAKLTSLDIYVTPTQSFKAKMRDVFKKTVVSFWSSKQAYAWLRGPNYKYWPQQLNFAVWCATGGCGISLREGELVGYPPVIQGFIKFHVYFTCRRVLYELGVPLPDDSAFDQTDNTFNKAAFHSLCNEFGLSSNPDFRFHRGRNHSLGDVFEYYSGEGYRNVHVDRGYDVEANTWPSKRHLFSDEGGKDGDGNLISLIRNDDAKTQYSWFIPSKGHGLTRKGMGRINRSLEAFVYCVLGLQVNIHSSIAGNSGGAVETQQEMLKLFESSVIDEDLSTSVQRYQLAVQEAKLRLDFAIAPGIWLMPSNLIINTGSIIGYNNELQKASEDMKFGVNETVNEKSKKVGIKHNMRASKVKLPHVLVKSPTVTPKTNTLPTESRHETNKSAYMIAAVGLGWYFFR